MEKKIFKVYITQFWSRWGILEDDVSFGTDAIGDSIVYSVNDPVVAYYKPEWYLTREEAVERVKQVLNDQITLLESKLDSLKLMKSQY